MISLPDKKDDHIEQSPHRSLALRYGTARQLRPGYVPARISNGRLRFFFSHDFILIYVAFLTGKVVAKSFPPTHWDSLPLRLK